MKFKEIAARLTGISCPVFGVSWNPPEAECTIARRVLTFLEDRRVLYVDASVELPHECVESILRIREMLTHDIGALAPDSELALSLRAMRAACRKFLSTVGADDRLVRFAHHSGHFASWTFIAALGELRGTFGTHLAKIAAAYGLDVEDDLARILPALDEAPEPGEGRGRDRR